VYISRCFTLYFLKEDKNQYTLYISSPIVVYMICFLYVRSSFLYFRLARNKCEDFCIMIIIILCVNV